MTSIHYVYAVMTYRVTVGDKYELMLVIDSTVKTDSGTYTCGGWVPELSTHYTANVTLQVTG